MSDYQNFCIELADKAARRAAAARTPGERESFARVRNTCLAAARSGSPEAAASYERAARAFEQHDATATARTEAITATMHQAIDAQLLPTFSPIVNSSFSFLQDRLPDWLRTTIERIDEQLEDARAVNGVLMTERMALMKERGDTAAQISMWTNPAAAARFGIDSFAVKDESHPDVVRWNKSIAKIDAKLAKVDAKIAALQPRIALDRLQERLQAYVRPFANNLAALTPRAAPTKKASASDLVRAVADIRNKIEVTKADLRELRARPRPSADVKSAARKLIEITARAPNVAQAVDYGDPIEWPIVGIAGEVVGGINLDGRKIPIPNAGAASFGKTNDALGVLLWALRDPITAAIDREIDAYADDANALNDADRAKGEAKLIAEILASEHDEEALIRAADEKDLPVTRRPNADPRAVLGLADGAPAMVEDFA